MVMIMDKSKNYEVKDLRLAEQGKKNIEWAESQMGALLKVRGRFKKEKPLKGIKIGMALHPTKETAALVRTLIAGGAEVAICACNPLSTQDDVAAALAKEGVKIWAYKGETKEDYYRYLNKVMDLTPVRRFGRPGELKGLAVLLASDASSFITGSTFVIDGGWSAW